MVVFLSFWNAEQPTVGLLCIQTSNYWQKLPGCLNKNIAFNTVEAHKWEGENQ